MVFLYGPILIISLIILFIADCVTNKGRKVLSGIGSIIVSFFRLVIGTTFEAPIYESHLPQSNKRMNDHAPVVRVLLMMNQL